MAKTPEIILQKIEDFERNIESFKGAGYNETQLRQQFINPFFAALGWDIANKAGIAPAYRDVIHEDAIKIGGTTKAPDYCFRIGPAKKFFVEAKKPAVDIKSDIDPAYQLRRYAWSAKLPLSILTDFEDFAVYDCQIRPNVNDKPSTARIFYCGYKEYDDKWEQIANIFSKEAVLKGLFDKFASEKTTKKGTTTVDKEILAEIENWRNELAKNIALRNGKLSVYDLNFAVQKTIDRILFLRICEDRGIEHAEQLLGLVNGARIYPRLFELFEKADERYNSGIFHFRREKDRPEEPDELSANLKVDDDVLKQIIKDLYYPQSPYEFSVMPAEILGNVYEQFLGKVIRLTAGHQAKVEEKPEVKKAGGVYYTPAYIVDYIIKNTVGRLIWGYSAEPDGTCTMCGRKELGAGGRGLGTGGREEDKTEEKGKTDEREDQELQGSDSLAGSDGTSNYKLSDCRKAAGKRKVCDGTANMQSGSIHTCQYCGRTWFQSSEGVCESSVDSTGFADGTGNLCNIDGKTGVYENQPAGADEPTDSKNRETSKRLNSLLKNQSQATDPRSLTPKQVAKLRILDPACGSGSFLIGAYQYLLDFHRDYYEKDHRKYRKQIYQGKGGQWFLTIDEKKRILLNNIYGVDIDSQAVEVTKLSLLLKVLENETQESLRLFHERALPDLGNNIKCGNSLIGPDFYQNQQLGLFDDGQQRKINAFDWKREFAEVFKQGGFDAVIGNPPYLYSAGKEYREYFERKFLLSQYQTDFYIYFIEKALSLAHKGGKFSFIVSNSWLKAENFSKLRNHLLTKHKIDLLTVFGYPVFVGATLENSIFSISIKEKPRTIPVNYFSEPNTFICVNQIDPSDAVKHNMIDHRKSSVSDKLNDKIEHNSEKLEHYLKINRGIHAYRTDGYGKSKFGSGPQIPKDKETCSYHADKPLNKTYLPELKGKDVFRFRFVPTGRFLSYGIWLAEPREPEYFFETKIVLRKILGEKLHGTYIEEPMAIDQSLYVLISKSKNISELKYFLGILLSRLGAWYLRTKYAIYDTLYPWYTKKQLAFFPVKEMDNRLVTLVEQMLELHKKISKIKNPNEKTRIQRQIDATDGQIDKLVYELYGLTEEEIRIVEGEE